MLDKADAYRRSLASREAGVATAWWYLGTTTLALPDQPEIIVNHVETVMIYRSEDLEGGAFRIPWWEIGLFRDAISGEIADTWLNPLSGAHMPAAQRFEEGPSGFSIRPAGAGIEMFDAVQAFAALESASVTVEEIDGRVVITQAETKLRSFPGRDGIPDLDRGEGTRSKTILKWSAAVADLATDAPSVPATGLYSFEIGMPPWLGMGDEAGRFMVKGLMHKAPLAPPLNPRGWADLQQLFPQHFLDGSIQPRWA